MNKTLLCALTTGMLFCACSSDLENKGENPSGNDVLKGINVTIESAENANDTRASYTVDPSEGFLASWTLGDTIGIYPVGGDQVAFPISDGEGTATAHFDGGAWALRDGRQYAAYYPFSKANSWVSETAIPVNYTGQEQDGDNSTAHLSKYDYLAATATTPESGSVNLQMKHLGAFVRFQLTMPEAATLTSAEIESGGAKFITVGTIDLTQETPTITPIATDAKLSLNLKNITCTAGQVVTLYAMVAPVNLSGADLTVTVNATGSKKYASKTAGSNIIAGKSYSYTITEVEEGPADYNGHDYVDLGLPSGLKWATMNVGANAPEDYGSYFAWGETEGYGQNTSDGRLFDCLRYKWSSKNDFTGLTKYTYPDNRTSGIWYSGNIFIGDRKTVLDKEDDAAAVNWGGSWRMPTKAEQDELRNNCTWTWITQNGVNGYKVKGTNNNWIFLPAAGYRFKWSLLYVGVYGHYWSSSIHDSYIDNAFYLYLTTSNFSSGYSERYDGLTVRAVSR